MRDREAERGEMKTNEEKESRGEVARQKSTGKRRRARLKHKELVVGKTLHLICL